MSTLQRIPMSYDQWLALPEKPKSEWVRGVAIMSPPQGPDQSDAQVGLVSVLSRAFPRLRVYLDVGVRLPDGSVRAPDVMLLTRRPARGIADEVPVLAVEIISPESRTEDTIAKAADYASSGVAQYWIVDQELERITVLRNAGGLWEELAVIDRSRPAVTVPLEDHGEVRLALADVLPRP